MLLDGVQRDDKFFRDARVRLACGDQDENLRFARGQRLDQARRSRSGWASAARIVALVESAHEPTK